MFLQSEDHNIDDFLNAVNFIAPQGFNLKYFIVPYAANTTILAGGAQDNGYERVEPERNSQDVKGITDTITYVRKNMKDRQSFNDSGFNLNQIPNEFPITRQNQAPSNLEPLQTDLIADGTEIKSPIAGVLVTESRKDYIDIQLKEAIGCFPKHTLLHFVKNNLKESTINYWIDHLDKIYKDGKKAYYDGIERPDCPFFGTAGERDAWNTGWVDASKEDDGVFEESKDNNSQMKIKEDFDLDYYESDLKCSPSVTPKHSSLDKEDEYHDIDELCTRANHKMEKDWLMWDDDRFVNYNDGLFFCRTSEGCRLKGKIIELIVNGTYFKEKNSSDDGYNGPQEVWQKLCKGLGMPQLTYSARATSLVDGCELDIRWK